MDSSFQVLEIILFAGVAGFLLFRLRSVLGRRTGNERRRVDPRIDPFAAPAPKPAPVAPQPIIDQAASDTIRQATAGLKGIAALKAADPSFDDAAFLRGARSAFEIILRAFAAADEAALAPLLSKDVLAAFTEAIRARQAAHETHQTTLAALKDIAVVDANVEGTTGFVTVKFVSDQINVTRDSSGKVVDGDPQAVVEKTDFWTFSRGLRSRDPNWILVATQSP